MFKTREEFENEMLKALDKTQVDVVCLAGFMRILTNNFVKKWKGRLLNIHPSLLPLFKGLNPQRQALESGVRVAGCTVHFVEVKLGISFYFSNLFMCLYFQEELDAGAIIVQESVSICVDETEESLIEKIKKVEHIAFPKALKLLATKKVYLDKDTGKAKWLLNSN